MSKVSASTSVYGEYDPSSSNADAVQAWEKAKDQAKDAGIQWERPSGDNRSAQQIIDDTPILRDLGNQEDVRTNLEDRVGGDIETDADAAYRAAQVLEHIEKLDESGNRVADGDIGNDEVNGFSRGGDAYHGTEAGRLKDFGENGFGFLKGELRDIPSASEDPEARSQAEDLGIRWERPDGDDRSAEDIVDGSDLLKNLGNQSDVKEMLKERVGDFENDADAAYRADQVLQHIERFDGDGQNIVGSDVGNGEVNGFSRGGEAYNGTEAGRLQDFGKYGFSSLKGEMSNPDSVGENSQAREAAEKAGIKWELPEGDERSAQDIIDDNPALAHLGNQSGVKDMLKERVGDYEKDADAAYRAMQVIDRVAQYNDKGEIQSGGGVANTSIDGFTSSDEARNDTEAGRLQDFGKGGFEALPAVSKPENSAGYTAFLKANPDADDASKQIAEYSALLNENFDLIRGKTGDGDHLTADSLKDFKDQNPQISDEFKEALDFWSQPGAFDKLETAQNPLKFNTDGNLSKKDIETWLTTHNPKDANAAIILLAGVSNANVVAGVDTSALGKDVFDNPGNYSTEQKAAVLQELLTTQNLITDGAAAGMWSTDYGKVSIANAVEGHPDPQKLLSDVNAHIKILESDPDVVTFMNESGTEAMTTLLDDNKGLKDAVQSNYDKIKSGDALNDLWDAKTKDGKTDQQAVLAEFFGSAQMHQSALGITDLGEIQSAVGKSEHNVEFETFYKDKLVSGDRLTELLADHTFEEATGTYSAEVAVYSAALDPDFTGTFDTELNDNYTTITQDQVFKDASFDDLKTAFGVDGGDELDEAKVKSIIEEVTKSNPEFFVNPDGKATTPDQILAGFRGSWDVLRQGTKSLSEMKPEWLSPGAKTASDKGLLHGVSGLFMAGVTISKGANSGGNLTPRQMVDITTGSVMTVTLLAEGGIKNFRDNLKGVVSKTDAVIKERVTKLLDDTPETTELKQNSNLAKQLGYSLEMWENAAKGLGGLAGAAAGAYGIFDGVQSIRKGDPVSGGISITAGSLGGLASLASAAEGGAFLLGQMGLRAALAPIAGVLGMAAAGVGAIAMLLPGLIAEGKQQTQQDNFGDLLGDTMTKYEIDGVPNGDQYDIPEEDWPETSDGLS